MKRREMIMIANGFPPGNNKYSEFGVGWVNTKRVCK
jgi:hypothetical protein